MIPNVQTVGVQRTATSLILPEELFTHNEYEINMAPPVESAVLRVTSVESLMSETFRPTVHGRQICFLVQVHNSGEHTFSLEAKNGDQVDLLDEETIYVMLQSFVKNETIVGAVDLCEDSVISHSWLAGTPLRVFMNQSSLANFQEYRYKVVRCNAVACFGIADSDDRKLQNVVMFCNFGIVYKQGKKVTEKPWSGFHAGDEVVVRIVDDTLSLQIGDANIVEEFVAGSHFFVELADAEVLIL